MSDFTSFTDEQRADLESCIALEDWLVQITPRNFRQVAFDVLASNFAHRAKLLPYLVSALMTVIHVRVDSIDLLAKLVRHIMDYDDPRWYQVSDLRPSLIRTIANILSFPNPFPQHTAVPHFLRALTSENCLSFRDFAAISRLYDPLSTISETSKKWLFCLFAPEVEEANPKFFIEMQTLCEEKLDDPFLEAVFSHFLESLPDLRKDDWYLLRFHRRNEFDCYSFASILDHDQLNYLAYQAKGSLFDPNERIAPSIFLRSAIVQRHPTLLHYAAFSGAIKCFKFLLAGRANTSVTDEVGTRLADFIVAGGRASFFPYLESLSLDVKRCLHTAIIHHQWGFYERLLTVNLPGMSFITATGANPMQQAISSGNLKVFMDCISRGISPEAGWVGGMTPVHTAALAGSLELSRALLLLMPEKLNVRDGSGRTPLHCAAASGNEKLVLFLLEQEGVFPGVPDVEGKTPLHAAAETGIGSIVRLILSMDVDVNAKDGGRGDVVFARTIPKRKLLPSQEVALIDKDRLRHAKASLSGRSALHLAAMYSKADVVETLLKHYGVDVNCRNNAGVFHSFIKHHSKEPQIPAMSL
jgi:ankyrin repeat protein